MPRRIERARAEDDAPIRALLTDCGLPADHVVPDRFLVVRQDGDLIGCVGIEVTGSTAMLQSLAVDSSYRGQGLGRRLVDAACGRARVGGCDRVVALTLDAAEYFAELGFRVIPRESLDADALAFWQFEAQVCSSATCLQRTLSRPAGVRPR